mmetsp:Transcript_56911/g.65208  ORF Transcript_56911/g.65208 Transcript_56911/m.65208 type:complete len:382 (-) Transcript_56911:171-1316(-)
MMYEEEQDMYQYITIEDRQQQYHEVASGSPQLLMNEQTRPQQHQDIHQRNLIVLGMNSNQQLEQQKSVIPLKNPHEQQHMHTFQHMTTTTPENPQNLQFAPPSYSYQQQYSFPHLNFAPQSLQNPILIQQQSNPIHSQNPYPQQQANNHAAAQHYNYAKPIQQQQNYNHSQQYSFPQRPQIVDIRQQKQGPQQKKSIILEPIMVENKSDDKKFMFPNQKQQQIPKTNSQPTASGSANLSRQGELTEQLAKKPSSFPATRQRIKQYDEKKQDTLTKASKKLSKIDVMKDFILELSQHFESTQKIFSPREIMTYAHQFTGRYPLVQEWESLAYCAGYFTPPTYCFNTKYICALTENGSPDRPRKSLVNSLIQSFALSGFVLVF